ncbi:MAG: hypothetical protein M3P40_02635 [Actinomycetota bacterium]|nr:hypothetical protein [Actinomycetota bacterium]
MTPLAVELASLLQVVAVSLVAGIGITAVFSVALMGIIRSRESRRDKRSGARFGWGALGVLAMLLFTAAVVQGLRMIAS